MRSTNSWGRLFMSWSITGLRRGADEGPWLGQDKLQIQALLQSNKRDLVDYQRRRDLYMRMIHISHSEFEGLLQVDLILLRQYNGSGRQSGQQPIRFSAGIFKSQDGRDSEQRAIYSQDRSLSHKRPLESSLDWIMVRCIVRGFQSVEHCAETSGLL